MRIVFHERYREVYSGDPAAKAGRMESVYAELLNQFKFVKTFSVNEEVLKLVHTENHTNSIKKHNLYENALLAVGGAIKASELAIEGEPSFGLIRPPGHHASQDRSWGFCFFNNVAISIEKLRHEGNIEKAIIVDIDLHFGDGTANIFKTIPEVTYFICQEEIENNN